MTLINKLPYWCKEYINLYALNTVEDYERLKVFNKIADYEPCEYSHIKLRKAEKNYIKIKAKQEAKQILFVNKAIAKHSFYHGALIGENIMELKKTYEKLSNKFLTTSVQSNWNGFNRTIRQVKNIQEIYKGLMEDKRIGNCLKKLDNKEKWLRFIDQYFTDNNLSYI